MFLLLFGIVFVGYGISALFMYYNTGGILWRTEQIIYGWPALAVAILTTIMGIVAVINFIIKRPNQLFKAGDSQVLVRRKIKKLGAVQSLELEFSDGSIVLFYCSATRVASSLLNDFEEEQMVLLRIKNQNGRNCELIGKSAYAHGMIIREVVAEGLTKITS